MKDDIYTCSFAQCSIFFEVARITLQIFGWSELLEAAGILEYELVQIVDVENGNRFETYTIAGEAGSGMICLNGAAARQVAVGDHVILMCYAQMTPEEAKEHHPKVVFVDADNHIARVTNYEKHGKLTDDFIGA